MKISNQIGRRSPGNTIPTTSKLYKTNGKALRNSRMFNKRTKISCNK